MTSNETQGQSENVRCGCGYDRNTLAPEACCPECGQLLKDSYTLASSWKMSRFFPAKVSFCATAFAFVCMIGLILYATDFLTDGFSGGTAGMGLVLMYLPVAAIAIFGVVLNYDIMFVTRHQCERKLAVLNLSLSILPLLPLLLIVFQIIRVVLGFG
tara:strand:- start:2309 stop:2779 length:471 start_codon:yes stop_codon:yes gene_type:complete